MFSSAPKYEKLTTNLKLAVSRLKLLEKKKTELAVKARREIAEYMRNDKFEGARIRVEHIVREDYLVEAMEIIEMYCDLLVARMGVLQTIKTVADGLEESVASLIWVTPRLQSEVPELVKIHKQLTLKFGREFAKNCNANSLGNVNEKLVSKLTIHTPPKFLVEKYMEEIAKSFGIPYTPPLDIKNDDADMIYENYSRDPKSTDIKGFQPQMNGGAHPYNQPTLPAYQSNQPPQLSGAGGYDGAVQGGNGYGWSNNVHGGGGKGNGGDG